MERNKEVDRYIAETPANAVEMMEKLREIVFAETEDIPEMSETYAYRIPVYLYGHKPIFSIAAFKDHCSLITQDAQIAEKIPELQNYKVSGTTIHFKLDEPLPMSIIKKVIAIRLADRRVGL